MGCPVFLWMSQQALRRAQRLRRTPGSIGRHSGTARLLLWLQDNPGWCLV